MTSLRRVVVTGLGAINPCGVNTAQTWHSIINGESGIGPITLFDATDWPVRIAGEVKSGPEGFDAATTLGTRAVKRIGRYSQLALVASKEAIADAGLPTDEPLGERVGVYIGSGIGGIGDIARNTMRLHEESPQRVSPFFIPRSLTNLAGGQVALHHGAKGPSLCISTACASGNHSIGEAWRAIRMGDADIIIAGGAESAIVPISIAGFMVMRALSKSNDTPQSASRPFDAERNGFVMGEGAGILVLEALDSALARGAHIYAELAGYGLTNDAHHITSPPPGHEGAARCMSLALQSAGIQPNEVDYINAHGTSTSANDSAETQAIKSVFGQHAHRMMVSSTKSMTGHLLGAAGGLEAVLTIKALDEGVIPPTINLDNPDPQCDLDYVPHTARTAPIQCAISNAFGFGGTNAVLAFRRYSDSNRT